MALSYESNTFHKIKNEIDSLARAGKDVSPKAIRSIVETRGENLEDFKRAYNAFRKSEQEGRDDFRAGRGSLDPGRIVGRFVGDLGRLPITAGKIILPEQIENEVESFASFIGEKIPLDIRTAFNATFDPYHGDNLLGKVEGGTTTLASLIAGGSGILRGMVYGAGKKGLGIGPKLKQTVWHPIVRKMARDTRKKKRAKWESRGRGVRAGTGFAAAQTLMFEPEQNLMDMLLTEFPESLSVLEHLSVNPDDPEAIQYLQSFINNLLLEAPVGALLGAGKLTSLADLEAGKVARTAKRMNNTTVIEEQLPLSSLENLAKKGLTSRFGGDDTTLAAMIRRIQADPAAMSRAAGVIEDAQKILLRQAEKEGIDLTSKLPKDHPFAPGQTFEQGIINEALAGNTKAFRYLKKNGFDETADAVMNMRNNIDDLSDLMVKTDPSGKAAGLVKGKLRATIQSRGRKGKKPGTYLNTAYGIWDDPMFPAWNNLPDNVKKDALDYLTDQGVKPDDALWTLKSMADRVPDREFAKGIDFIAAYGGLGSSRIFSKKKEIPQTIKTLMGEIKDPWKNYARTMEKMSIAQSEADFLHGMRKYLLDNELAKEGVKRKRVKGQPVTYELPEGTAREGLVSLKDVGVERLGKVIGKASVEKYGVNPFENLFASKEYSDFFREGIDLVKPTSEMWAQALKLKAITQSNQTVLSSSTHGRNTFGNVIIMLANGMNPWSKGAHSFKVAASRIMGKTNTELGEEIADYQLRGVMDSSVRAQTLRKTAGDAFHYESPNSILRNWDKGPVGKAGQKIFQTYQAEDDFFKIMHYNKTQDDLFDIFKQDITSKSGKKVWDDLYPTELKEKIKEMSAQRTRDLMPNYALVPKAIKWLRRTPFSDFPAFTSEMVRISKNLVKFTYDDIVGNTANKWGITDPKAKQLIANMGWRRAAGMGLGAISGEAAVHYSMNVMGLTKDDVDSINRLAPRWEQNTRKIFLSPINIDKNNHIGVNYVNLGPIDPFHYMRTPAQFLYSSLKSGTEINDADINRLGMTMVDNALGMFIHPSMITTAAVAGLGALEPNARDQLIESGWFGPGMLALGEEIANPFVPGFVQLLNNRRLYEKSRAARPELGAVSEYDYTMPEMEYRGPGFWGKVIGIRPQRMDISAAMRRNLASTVRDIEGASGRFTTAISRPNITDPKQVFELFRDSQVQRIKDFQHLRSLTNAYDQLITDERIGKLKHPTIKDRRTAIYKGVTRGEGKKFNQNIFDFMDRAREDRYLPFWMSEGAEQAAKYSSYAPIPTNEMRRFYNFLENQPISQY